MFLFPPEMMMILLLLNRTQKIKVSNKYLGTGFSIFLVVIPLRLCIRSILPASIAAGGTPIGAGGGGGRGGPGGGGGGGGGIVLPRWYLKRIFLIDFDSFNLLMAQFVNHEGIPYESMPCFFQF